MSSDELRSLSWPASREGWQRFALAVDEAYPLHVDPAPADASGFAGPIGLGSQIWAYLHEALRRWFPEHDLLRMQGRVVSPWHPDQHLVVAERGRSGQDGQLTVDLVARAADGPDLLTATAVLADFDRRSA